MNLLASILRTVVPLVAGWVLTVTGALGIEADSAAVAGGVTAAVTAAYYLLLRLAEDGAARLRWEPLRLVAGVLLGWARPPQYPGKAAATTLEVRLDPALTEQAVRDAVRKLRHYGGQAR